MDTLDRAVHEAGAGGEAAPPGHTDHTRLHVVFQHLNEILATAPFIIMITDADDVIEYVNPRFEEATGFSQTKTIGQKVTQISSDPVVNEEAWRALRAGEGWRGEITYLLADGSECHTLASIQPLRSSTGEIVRYFGLQIELTEQKRVERELREREAYWQALVESAPVFIVTLDRDGKIATVNREIDGGRPEDAIGHTLFDFAEESAHETIARALDRVFKDGETVQLENRAALTTGEVRWFAYTIGPVKDGDEVVGGVLVSHDITENKEAEEKLRESESQWRALLENAPDYILIVDREGIIQRLNRAAEGALPADIVGHRVFEYADRDQHTEWQSALEQVFSTGERLTIESRSYNMGEPRWFSASVGPVYDGGEVTAAVVVARDVTIRMLAEERLKAFATAVSDLIVAVDEDGVLQEVLGPRGGRGLLPMDPAWLRGTRLQDHMSKERAEAALDFVRRTISGGRPLEEEGRFTPPTGEIWALARAAPLTLNDGRTLAVIHVSDITKRKQMERELETLREEVETKAEARQEKGAELGLTFRELTVLGLIARGRSDKEIAGLLGVSPFTVNKQSASAMRKLDSRSRSEAVARAVRAGII